MAAKPVQISLDTDLLERIDRDPETQAEGRSAFMRKAVERYLAAKRRHDIDARIVTGYQGQPETALRDVAGMIDAQSWPDE
jgi:metal-responsive CopG/Arc/MetJ family transcriptional regulator